MGKYKLQFVTTPPRMKGWWSFFLFTMDYPWFFLTKALLFLRGTWGVGSLGMHSFIPQNTCKACRFDARGGSFKGPGTGPGLHLPFVLVEKHPGYSLFLRTLIKKGFYIYVYIFLYFLDTHTDIYIYIRVILISTS